MDGYTFHSTSESYRYEMLKERLEKGEIENLVLQPEFKVYVNGVYVFSYFSDFQYYDTVLSQEIVEDVKGFKTDVYKLKKKCVEALYGVRIIEIPARICTAWNDKREGKVRKTRKRRK